MPGRVVVVHDDQELLDEMTNALKRAGNDVAAFIDPMAALSALETAERIQVLVTRMEFPLGKPNGLSLALMARTKRPLTRVLFTARLEFAEHAKGVGEFLPLPIKVADVVATVGQLLKPD